MAAGLMGSFSSPVSVSGGVVSSILTSSFSFFFFCFAPIALCNEQKLIIPFNDNSIQFNLLSVASKRVHEREKQILVGCKHNMFWRQTFEVWSGWMFLT